METPTLFLLVMLYFMRLSSMSQVLSSILRSSAPRCMTREANRTHPLFFKANSSLTPWPTHPSPPQEKPKFVHGMFRLGIVYEIYISEKSYSFMCQLSGLNPFRKIVVEQNITIAQPERELLRVLIIMTIIIIWGANHPYLQLRAEMRRTRLQRV